jgi:hemerythrin-like domain-containing protein
MDFSRQIVRVFHDDHMAALGVLGRIDSLLARYRKTRPDDPTADRDFTRLLSDIEFLITGELPAHFAFEENEFFPLLANAGEAELGTLLAEEHVTIIDVADRFAKLCSEARQGPVSDEDWAETCRLGAAFVTLLAGHIEKEEMALLPALDDIVEQTRDGEMVMTYAATR